MGYFFETFETLARNWWWFLKPEKERRARTFVSPFFSPLLGALSLGTWLAIARREVGTRRWTRGAVREQRAFRGMSGELCREAADGESDGSEKP